MINSFQYVEQADGLTSYTLSSQVMDNNNHPVHASSITCKTWLTKDINTLQNISANNSMRLKSVDTLAEPFPGEVIKAFIFNASTPQTQLTDANGQAVWNYTVASFVTPGIYYIVVLVDWKGISYNFYAEAIKIQLG